MTHHFTWPRGGMSGAEVEYLLRQYGIAGTGREMGNQFGYSVPAKQANLAEYILCCAQIPLTSPLLDGRNPVRAARRGYTMPPPWGVTARASDALGLVVDAFDTALGGAASRPAAAFVRSRAKSSKRRRGGWWVALKGLW